MKLKLTLLAAALAAFAASTGYANEGQQTGTATEAEKPVKAEAKKPIKKHSHMEEKTGIPISASATNKEKPESAMKADRHDHAKDKH